MPIPVLPTGHSVEDSSGILLTREEAQGSGPPSHFPKSPLQDVGRAYLVPKLFGEGVVVQAVVEIVAHIPDCPFLFHALNCLMTSLRIAALKIFLSSAMQDFICTPLSLTAAFLNLSTIQTWVESILERLPHDLGNIFDLQIRVQP